MKASLRDKLEYILLTYRNQIWADDGEPAKIGDIPYADQATDAILQAFADRLDDSKITTLTGDPKFKFDGSPETFKRLWNAHIADIRASMGIE